eukprot:gene3499-3998_t
MRVLLLLVVLAVAFAATISAQPKPSLRDHFASALLEQGDAAPTPMDFGAAAGAPRRPLKVGIIGAGMAGLYSAMILKDLGIKYEVLEASNRIGGRAYTHRFSDDPFNYIDFGAMRFPRIPVMDRVVGAQNFSLVSKLAAAGHPVTTIPYFLSHPNNINFFNGQYVYHNESLANDALHFGDQYHGGNGSAVPDCYTANPTTYWVGKAIRPLITGLYLNFTQGLENLMAIDRYSVRGYLTEVYKDATCSPTGTPQGYDQMAITWMEMMTIGTGFFDYESIMEGIMNMYDFTGSEFYAIQGGMSELPKNMVKVIGRENVQRNMRVTKIAPTTTTTNGVTRNAVRVYVDGEGSSKYDHVISTVSLGIMQRIDTNECNISFKKRQAYRVLNYAHSVKVGMSFRTRWWEDSKVMKGRPIFGGEASTDLPMTGVNYPSYGFGSTDGPSALIVAYTYGSEGTRLASMIYTEEDYDQLTELLLNNLAIVHQVEVSFLRRQLVDMEVFNWDDVPTQSGSFAGFGPSQFSTYFADLTKSEVNGTLHFAGEATSVHHAWIIGALNSAYRSVDKILATEGWTDLRQKLIDNWGTVAEYSVKLPPIQVQPSIVDNLNSNEMFSPRN